MNSGAERTGARLWSWRRDEKNRSALKAGLLASLEASPATLESILETLPEKDSIDLLKGSVKNVRRAVAKIQRRIPQSTSTDGARLTTLLREVQRPKWVIRERNRSSVRPTLVSREPSPFLLRPMSEIAAEVQRLRLAGAPVVRVLDWLQTTSHLDCAACRGFLEHSGYQISEDQIDEARQARHFWKKLAEFTEIYGNATRLGQLDPVAGEWGYVAKSEIPAWLPRLRVPKMHRRDEYLVRLLASSNGSMLDLDFYSVRYLPLFTAPTGCAEADYVIRP